MTRPVAPNRPGPPERRASFACPIGAAHLFHIPLSITIAAILAAVIGCGHRDSNRAPAGSSRAGAPSFVDIAGAAGLHYNWKIAGDRPLNILQTIGNGCAFLDYDNDGNLDILLIGPHLSLYRGDGRGHFTDVSHSTGLDRLTGHFLGCAVGDVDGDGFEDIYVSGYKTGLLLHNEGGRRFRDVTRQSGLKPSPWGTSCAFAQTSAGTGRLDLYVAGYAVFDPAKDAGLCLEQGVKTSCPPRSYVPRIGSLYRNEGSLRFTDVTKPSGAGSVRGRSLGAAFADYNDCGSPGLAIANDEMPGDLLLPAQNHSGGKLRSTGDESGTAYDRDGNVHGGMGLDWGDYDNDGRLDLFVATFQNESKSLYHNDGAGHFSDLGVPSGLGSASAPFVAFGCKFLDYDNDGRLDLALANGHVQDNISAIDRTVSYRQRFQLFHNEPGKQPSFKNSSASCSPEALRPIVGRGLAIGDFDNDGRMDVLVVDSEGKPLLLHNTVQSAGHWLGVRLMGPRGNRDGYGARLTADAGALHLLRQCQACGSYLSSSDRRVHFGLGDARVVERLTVKWPDGSMSVYRNIPADRYITLREGDSALHY